MSGKDCPNAVFTPLVGLGGIIRVYSPGLDCGPYDWCVTADFVEKRVVELKAIREAPTTEQWRAVITEMKKHEVDRLIWRHLRKGTMCTSVRSLR
jgi:hypothetical protein